MYINNQYYNPKRFSSGEMKLLEKDFDYIKKDSEITIIYKFEESFLDFLIIMHHLKEFHKDITLYLCYLPYQRMDHNNGYELESVKYMAQILNQLELKQIYIGEPHCALDYFKNSKPIPFVDIILKQIRFTNPNFTDNQFVFTDKGSMQKFSHLSKNNLYFEKSRNKTTGLIESHQLVGTINTPHLILVDDIISTGDTIISCINSLPKNVKVDIVCGHFEDNKYNGRLFQMKQINHIYSSNSICRKKSNKKLTLFSCVTLIKQYLGEKNEINQ